MAQPSAALTDAARDIIRKARPELNESQVEAAADVLAGRVQPEATTVDRAELQRTRAKVEEAIERHSAGEGASLD